MAECAARLSYFLVREAETEQILRSESDRHFPHGSAEKRELPDVSGSACPRSALLRRMFSHTLTTEGTRVCATVRVSAERVSPLCVLLFMDLPGRWVTGILELGTRVG
jgi:hypothetical protein